MKSKRKFLSKSMYVISEEEVDGRKKFVRFNLIGVVSGFYSKFRLDFILLFVVFIQFFLFIHNKFSVLLLKKKFIAFCVVKVWDLLSPKVKKKKKTCEHRRRGEKKVKVFL